MIAMAEERAYIPLGEVAEALGVVRGTLYHHLKAMKIKPKKFPFDRKTYISRADFEKLLTAKRAADAGEHS